MMVPRMYVMFERSADISAPTPAATTVAAIGMIWTAVIWSRELVWVSQILWDVSYYITSMVRLKYSRNVIERVVTTDTAVSTIQSTHASVVAQYPQAGTHRKTHISISVANPIGQVARYSGSTGLCIMRDQAQG